MNIQRILKKRPIYIEITSFVFVTIALILYASNISAQKTIDPNFIVDSLNLIDSKRLTGTDYEYTYSADLTNNGPDVTDVIATLTSASTQTIILDGVLNFSDIAAGTTATSTDTFVIRHDQQYPFDPDVLMWHIDAERAVTEVDGYDVEPEDAQITDSE